MAVATPYAASVFEPVVPAPAIRNVSLVIAMVIAPEEPEFTNVTAVPIGNATDALAGMVTV